MTKKFVLPGKRESKKQINKDDGSSTWAVSKRRRIGGSWAPDCEAEPKVTICQQLNGLEEIELWLNCCTKKLR